MSNTKNSLFGGLFGNQSNKGSDSSDSESTRLRHCLVNLSSATQGQSGRLDGELAKLKKMLLVGSPITEIEAHISLITDLTVQLLNETNHLQEDDLINAVSGKTFIDFVLQQELGASLSTKLANYQRSLGDHQTLAMVLPDLLELLETEPVAEPVSDPLPELNDSYSYDAVDANHIKAILSPIVQLLQSLEVEDNRRIQVKELISRSEKVINQEHLISFVDDVSTLIIGTINSTSEQFEAFLRNLKDRLDSVGQYISQNIETNEALSACSDKMSKDMSTQVGELRNSMTEAKSLDELESHVATSLEQIIAELDQFNSERAKLELSSETQIEELQCQLQAARSEAEHLRDTLQQQRQRALTDSLTHLPNRHAYNERIHLEYNRWRRYKKPLSLVVADVDHFKAVNDTYGHSAGDHALQTVSDSLTSGLRETDFIARYGGEEFVIILPETTMKDAMRAMNKLRNNIQNLTIKHDTKTFQLTMSFGVSSFEASDDFNLVFNRADSALYRAKNNGRNQVCAELKKSL